MRPRFSIIIPTLNRRAMLARALASVRAQTYDNIEVIVVDGGSTDGTLDDLAAAEVRVVPGPDRGVYDAINKGIAAASGDIIGLLNSDDAYTPDALIAAATAFAAYPDADSICGISKLVDEAGHTVAVFDDPADQILATPRPVLLGSCTPNARFFLTKAARQIGIFNPDYRFVADRDWLMRWFEAGLRTRPIPQTVYCYRQHPGSLTFSANRVTETAIRRELITLARVWQRMGMQAQTRYIAMLLEGRCIATLTLDALRRGDIAEATRTAFGQDGRLSLSPALKAIPSGLDWLARNIAPSRHSV